MWNRFGLNNLYIGVFRYGTYILVATVACFAIYPAIFAQFRANLDHLVLIQLSSSSNAWTNAVTSEKLLVGNADLIDKIIVTVEPKQSMTVFSGQCVVKDDPIECASLSSMLNTMAWWHFSRGRQELGELFIIFDSIHYHQDVMSLSALSSIGARGIMLDVGASLNELKQFQRSSLYLEAALEFQPTSYRIIRQLAILYLAEQDYCRLMRVSGAGVDYYDSALFYYYLGRAYEGLEAWDLAISAYEQALARFPNYEPYERRLNRVTQLAENNLSSNIMSVCNP
jgi:tetratricopeptide (TPR) repeat protein